MTVADGQIGILLSCLVAWFLSQAAKAVFNLISHRQLNLLQAFFATGGMPSGHAASVAALTLAIFLHEGVSTAFAVALILMFVTLRDAVGVRLAAGEQALFTPCRNIEQTVAVLQEKYGANARICVLPEGPLTIAYVAG